MLNNFDVFWDEKHQIYQIRTKTDIYAIEFDEVEKRAVFDAMILALNEKPNMSLKALMKSLQSAHGEHKILEVLNDLRDSGLLSNSYYADLAIYNNEARQEIQSTKDKSICIVGSSNLMKSIEQLFKQNKYKKVSLFSFDSLLKSNKDIIQNQDFFVVDGHEWNPVQLDELNRVLVKAKKPWLYVKGIEGTEVKVGPIFLGGELGCYNCLQKRLNSNDELLAYNETYKNFLSKNGRSAQSDQLPNNEAALNILANLAYLEVNKYFEQWALPVTLGKYVSFDMVSYKSTEHHLLKIPYCEVCKPKLAYNLAPWLESVTLK